MDMNSLTQVYTKRLLEEITDGLYSSLSILPSEVDIAKHFSISRTILRDCLSILDREGFISRKRGIGTVINRHVLEVKARMDLEIEFFDMIRDAGFVPSSTLVGYGRKPAEWQCAKALHLKEGEEVFYVSRLMRADGTPAIYCIDIIPCRLLSKEDFPLELLKKPIFELLAEYGQSSVYLDLTHVLAILADAETSRILEVEESSPLLHLQETGYSFGGMPVLYSLEYYRQDKLSHIILRKKI